MNENPNTVMRLLDPGFGATLQDRGRPGWRRWGVPCGGAMDPHSADCANRLLENEPSAPVVELLSQGARFQVLQECWLAICGAEVECNIPVWRAFHAMPGDVISVKYCNAGMWSYLAVAGGFAAPRVFGSASCYTRGGLGRRLEKDSLLDRESRRPFALPAGIAGRIAAWSDRRNFAQPPRFRVWPGPQWSHFAPGERDRFLAVEWKVSSQSDRVGYRLEGAELRPDPAEILSEPVRPGSIQVPENGQPIVTMADGPTVGGYPKIAWVDRDDLPWLAQCRPGQFIGFELGS